MPFPTAEPPLSPVFLKQQSVLVIGIPSPLGSQREAESWREGEYVSAFVCFVLSGCFADPVTVKGNDIWE